MFIVIVNKTRGLFSGPLPVDQSICALQQSKISAF